MADRVRVGLVLAAFFAAGAVNAAYFPLWCADRGLTASDIGVVLGAASLLRILGGPGAGWIADRLGRPRLVIGVAAALAAMAASVMPGLGDVMPILLASALLGLCASVLPALTDAVTLALAAARRLEYGPTRAWGSASFMVATAAVGGLVARVGTGVVPWLMAGLYGVAALAALRLPRVEAPRRTAGPVTGLWRSGAFRLALLATALIQGSHAAYYAFAPLHWRAAGLGDATIGLLIAEGIVAEVALFLWGRRLVERLGPAGLTGVAALAFAVRWSAMAFIVDWPALAVLQLLHAATFACQHLSAMLVLRRLPAERAGMAQTLVAALGFSAPTAVLVWLTGQLYGQLGGQVFLLMAAIGGAAVLLVRPLAGATGPCLGTDR